MDTGKPVAAYRLRLLDALHKIANHGFPLAATRLATLSSPRCQFVPPAAIQPRQRFRANFVRSPAGIHRHEQAELLVEGNQWRGAPLVRLQPDLIDSGRSSSRWNSLPWQRSQTPSTFGGRSVT